MSQPCDEYTEMAIEWNLPHLHTLDMAPRLVDAVVTLLHAGPNASDTIKGAATAALALLVHAPAVHSSVQLWQFLPSISTLADVLTVCAQLPYSSERSLLLLGLKFLASLALHAPEELTTLGRLPLLWNTSWLPIEGYAQHASMLLQTLHVLAITSMATCKPKLQIPPLGIPHVATQLLLADGGTHPNPCCSAGSFLEEPSSSASLGGRAGWQLDCKLRSLAILITVVDGDGFDAQRPASAADRLLNNSAAHTALVSMLRWAAGPLQAEMSRCHHTCCPTTSLDAPDSLVAHTMLLVLAAAIGLIARLLQTAHGTRCAFHDALLAPSTATGVQCLGTCVVLHAQIVDGRASLTTPYGIAQGKLNVDVNPSILPLCLFGVASIGPLGARCLALLCHAAHNQSPSGGLLLHLWKIGPAISCTLRSWLDFASADDEAGGSARQARVESGCGADCASAALQLLGAAAEAEHRLFASLIRGAILPGEMVRVQLSCCEPEGGWGFMSRGKSGYVCAVDGDAIFVDLETHGLWIGARSAQLELCAPAGSKANVEWKLWGNLKPTDRSAKVYRDQVRQALAATRRCSSPPQTLSATPLQSLWRLLRVSSSSTESVGTHQLLQLQALMVLAELWRSPTEHASALLAMRKDPAFWEALGAVVHLPDATRMQVWLAASHALVCLRHALGLQVLSRELALASGPTSLELAAARMLSGELHWLAGADPNAIVSSGAGVLASVMLSASLLPHASRLLDNVRLLAFTTDGDRYMRDEAGLPTLGSTPFACARIPRLAPPFSQPAEACMDVLMSLWAGGYRRAYPTAVLFDIEAIKLRAWRLRKCFVRGRYDGSRSGQAAGTVVANALAGTTERAAVLGEECAANDTVVLLDRLSGELSAQGVGGSATPTLLHLAQLAKAAAAYNAACLTSLGHVDLIRSWRVLLSTVSHRRHVVWLPTPMVVAAAASAPRWLDGVSEEKSLEVRMEARICELAHAQQEWVAQVTVARQHEQNANAIDAATMLLVQQGLALRCGPAFAWQLVHVLVFRPPWQKRYNCLCEKAAGEEYGAGASLASHAYSLAAQRVERAALRETKVLVLQTLLDDIPQARPCEVGDGWQLLHKLTAQACVDIETMQSKPTHHVLRSPSARMALALAVAELKERDTGLKLQVARSTSWSEDEKVTTLTCQFATLSKQLLRAADISPVVTEHQARVVSDLLASSAGSAMQMIQRRITAQPKSAPTTGEHNDRHALMGCVLSKLARARECLLQQAAILHAWRLQSQRASRTERRADLRLIASAELATPGAWAAAGRVHASLATELKVVAAHIAEREDAVRVDTGDAVERLLDERMTEASYALAECQRATADSVDANCIRSLLSARVQCCARVLEFFQSGKDGAAMSVEALANSTASLQSAVGSPTPPILGQSPSQVLATAASALMACEVESSHKVDPSEDLALALQNRAAQVHEVMCVLALTLHHERTAGVLLTGARPTPATLVRSPCSGEMHPSFFPVLGNASDTTLHPLDQSGRCMEREVAKRSPPGLCAILWPAPAPDVSALPSLDNSAWQTFLPSALRSFALNAAASLGECLPTTGIEQYFAETAACVLQSLIVLLKSPSGTLLPVARLRLSIPPSLLSSTDGAQLLRLLASTLSSLPAACNSMAHASLMGSVVLLLSYHSRYWSQMALPTSLLQHLAQKLCGFAFLMGRRPESSTVLLAFLSRLLSLISPRIEGAATRLMVKALDSTSWHELSLLPSLLRLVTIPCIAEELVQGGLVRDSASRTLDCLSQRPMVDSRLLDRACMTAITLGIFSGRRA